MKRRREGKQGRDTAAGTSKSNQRVPTATSMPGAQEEDDAGVERSGRPRGARRAEGNLGSLAAPLLDVLFRGKTRRCKRGPIGPSFSWLGACQGYHPDASNVITGVWRRESLPRPITCARRRLERRRGAEPRPAKSSTSPLLTLGSSLSDLLLSSFPPGTSVLWYTVRMIQYYRW